MSDKKIKLSVIIPVASWDESWLDLVDDIKAVADKSIEIVFVTEKEDEFPQLKDIKESLKASNINNVTAPSARAKAMNAGAKAAKGEFLWFLQSDSRFAEDSFRSLLEQLAMKPDALHYFRLQFANDGPPLMFINEIGGNIRSSIFRLPFGDQGFCIKKSAFETLGKFDEEIEAGEDSLFIWRAHQNKYPLNRVRANLIASARKYSSYGWLELTLENQRMWLKQAWPELKKLIKRK